VVKCDGSFDSSHVALLVLNEEEVEVDEVKDEEVEVFEGRVVVAVAFDVALKALAEGIIDTEDGRRGA
jgi:hypothetical protein